MRIYLDTNAVQSTIDLYPSAASLQEVFRTHGFELGLGMHVIYELGRAFSSPVSQDSTRPYLRILAEMDEIHYVPQARQLMDGEATHLRYGGRPLHVLSELDRVATKSELYWMATGHTDGARQFVERREAEIAEQHNRISAASRRMVQEFFRQNPGAQATARAFGGFREALRPLWHAILALDLPRVPRFFFDRAFARAEEFPIINTWLNCQLHLDFLAWRSPDLPSRRRLDDYRHAIESNATDLFVSGDADLIELYPALNPFLQRLPWEEFAGTLRA